MSLSLVRPILTVAVAGASLWGGMSLTRYVENSPALLYAAGEVRMAIGCEKAGLRLISRAEAIREAKSRAAQAKAADPQKNSDPQPKKVEVCTHTKKPATAAKPALGLPGGEARMTPPEAPTPPQFRMVAAGNVARYVYAANVPVMSYTSNAYTWNRHESHIKIEVLKKIEKAHDDARCKQAMAFAAVMRNQTVDAAAIMRSVSEQLKKSGVSNGSMMMVQPPVAATE